MTNTNRPQNRALKYTLLGSLVLHVVGAYIVMRTVDFTPDPIEPTELTVNVVTDDDLKRLSAPLKEKLEKREREKREEEKEKEVKFFKLLTLQI